MHAVSHLRSCRGRNGLAVALATGLMGVISLDARTIRVDHSVTAGGDGSTWAAAYPDLQSALAAASAGDEVWVAEGTYRPDQGASQSAGDRSSTFALASGVAIYGGFTDTDTLRTDRHPLDHPTVLCGDLLQNDATTGNALDNAYHVVTGNGTDATAVLDGFHIRSGHANNEDAPDNGGGGLICNGGGSPSIRNCVFTGNRASDLGGAVYANDTSNPTLTNCVFSGNHAFLIGGAVCSTNSSHPAIVNCTFAGNSVTGFYAFGGALYSSPSASPTLVNSILWDNTASTDGDQLYGDLDPSSSHNLVGGAPLGGHVISASNPLFIRDPDPGTDELWTGPSDNDYGDLRVQPASPAYDSGLNAANATPRDAAASFRLQNGVIDLGAYERPLILTVSNTNDGGPGSLREAIAAIISPGGGTIRFDPAVNGQTITLSNGPLLIDKTLIIDASALLTGLTISGGRNSRVFEIGAAATVMLDTLTVTGGETPAGANGPDGADQPGGGGDDGQPGTPSGDGGGILNHGHLTLNRVTVTGNRTGPGGNGGNSGAGATPGLAGSGARSGHGGGISTSGDLILINSTVANNHTGPGGNAGTGTGSFAGAAGSGGGIHNTGRLTLLHATITDNSVGANGTGTAPIPGSGGGVRQLGQLVLENSIIAENSTGVGGPDLDGAVTTPSGVNFVGNPAGASGLGPHLLTGNPFLSPLGANGGPTPTRAPSFDSPAVDPVNGATFSRLATDQRGISRIVSGIVDIGAVEALLSAVVTSSNDSGPGSLRDSLLGVETGGLITFDPGLDGAGITLSGAELPIVRSVSIDASALPSGITIDAGGVSRVFTIDDGRDLVFSEVLLSNLTITGGISSGNGGGIANRENLTMLHCTITANSAAGHSGGIWFGGGSSRMENCTVSNNSAASAGGGGGLRLDTGASLALETTRFSINAASSMDFASRGGGSLAALAGSTLSLSSCTFESSTSGLVGGAMSLATDTATVSDCEFTRNSSTNGGAVYLLSASPAFNGCRMTGNQSLAAGGAICMASSSNPVISNSFFEGNSADHGGATYHADSSPAFTNCVFSGNHASTLGGAVDNSASPAATFTNCAFSANTAGTGGAIYSNASTPILTHCILWGNNASTSAAQIFGTVSASSERNLIQDGSGPHVLLTTDPRFVLHPDPGPDGSWSGLDDNNYGNLRLLADSPAIDAGTNEAYDDAALPPTDIIRRPRKIGTIDLGPYEGSYLIFAVAFPHLVPEGDANGNGISNFIDYAIGTDPEAPQDPQSLPAINNKRLTFSHRPDPAMDTFPSYERSSDLVNWMPMTEGLDYRVNGTSTSGTQVRVILDLLPPSRLPEVYFRQGFSIVK